MSTTLESLPEDPATLKALLIAERVRNERLVQIIKELQRHRFGRRAETLPEDQLLLALDDKDCPGCHGQLHRIGEDISERLDIVPARFRVLVTRRPKYACRSCEEVVAQAPAPARLIEGGIPTEATVAQVLVSKYADHLPLYRQAQIYARQGVNLDRSTLADWVGRAAWHLWPVHERLLAHIRTSTKIFADETTAPVLDPGRGANQDRTTMGLRAG
jgi:transposase